MRAAGLSAAKTRSIRALASGRPAGSCPPRCHAMGDEELIERLSAVPASAAGRPRMFLIFQLGRLDVWPVGDLGVRKGYAAAWGLPDMPTQGAHRLRRDLPPLPLGGRLYCWRAVDTVVPTRSPNLPPARELRRSPPSRKPPAARSRPRSR